MGWISICSTRGTRPREAATLRGAIRSAQRSKLEVIVDRQRRVVAEHLAGVDGLAPGEGGNAGRGKVVVGAARNLQLMMHFAPGTAQADVFGSCLADLPGQSHHQGFHFDMRCR